MNTTASGLTATEIESLKQKHGPLQEVTITDGEATHKAIIREPDLKELSAANAISKTDEIKGSMVLYDACVVAVDEAVHQRAVLKMQVVAAIGDRMGKLSRSVKNL